MTDLELIERLLRLAAIREGTLRGPIEAYTALSQKSPVYVEAIARLRGARSAGEIDVDAAFADFLDALPPDTKES